MIKLLNFPLILTTFLITGCTQIKTQFQVPKPPEQDSFIQAYFNHNQSNQFYDPRNPNQLRPGDNLEEKIIQTIAKASYSIKIAVQEINSIAIANSLKEQFQKGIKIKIIIDNKYNQSNNPALKILTQSGIPIIDDTADGSKGSGLVHHKFIVIDHQLVIVSSANFTPSDFYGDPDKPNLGNANHLLTIKSSELAIQFNQEFDLMWGDGPNGKLDSKFGVNKPYRGASEITLPNSTIALQFSPTSNKVRASDSTSGLIAKTLNQSQSEINAALFVFSDPTLSHILEQKSKENIKIRVLIDPRFAYRSYSQGLAMMGVKLCSATQKSARPWNSPINTVGVPQLKTGDLLHHKIAIIDQNTVIAGSQNWSTAADKLNDETVIIIKNSTVAALFQQEFNRLYTTANLEIPSYIQNKIKRNQAYCNKKSTL